MKQNQGFALQLCKLCCFWAPREGGGLDTGDKEEGTAVFFAVGLGLPTALAEVSVGSAVFWFTVFFLIASALTHSPRFCGEKGDGCRSPWSCLLD